MSKVVTIIEWESGDWAAAYVDGAYVTDGHSIYTDDWENLINKHGPIGRVEQRWLTGAASDKLQRGYRLLAEYAESDFQK